MKEFRVSVINEQQEWWTNMQSASKGTPSVWRVQCALQMVGGVGWQLRGLRGIAEDWPDWISITGVMSPGPAWCTGRQQGANQMAATTVAETSSKRQWSNQDWLYDELSFTP